VQHQHGAELSPRRSSLLRYEVIERLHVALRHTQSIVWQGHTHRRWSSSQRQDHRPRVADSCRTSQGPRRQERWNGLLQPTDRPAPVTV